MKELEGSGLEVIQAMRLQGDILYKGDRLISLFTKSHIVKFFLALVEPFLFVFGAIGGRDRCTLRVKTCACDLLKDPFHIGVVIGDQLGGSAGLQAAIE